MNGLLKEFSWYKQEKSSFFKDRTLKKEKICYMDSVCEEERDAYKGKVEN